MKAADADAPEGVQRRAGTGVKELLDPAGATNLEAWLVYQVRLWFGNEAENSLPPTSDADALAVVLGERFGLGRSRRARLKKSIERLMTRSTLHMSRPFRRYVLDLVRDLVGR